MINTQPVPRNYVGAFTQEAQHSRVKRMNERGDSNVAVKGIYNIIFGNDLLSCEITDFISDLEGSSLYKHESKQLAKKLKAAISSYEREMYKVMGDRSSYFADSAEKMCELVKKDRDILYWSIKQVLDDHKVKHSGILASSILVHTIAQYCCTTVDFYIKQISEIMSFDCSHLDYLRLDNVLRLSKQLSDKLCKLDTEIDLNSSDRCVKAFEAFANKMGDIENIRKSIDY